MEKHVINLTKFKATAELERFGVRDLTSWKEFQEIRNLLFFPTPPTQEIVGKRVERLTEIALKEAKKSGADSVLVSCPPWMMQALCRELVYHNLRPVVSFTKKTNDEGMSIVDLVAAA
ncbi:MULTISPECIES: hypothetical protein [Pseudomonadaceae]|uniref:hypothetical protein n=1 Tax=Pseudomonadaceae TaxID=135621 RepID=UPI001E6F7DD1|nr:MULTISPECIES: hypothetical protein [Pseudomonadaceae]MCP8473821.1 hypothetical protein [Pseudomonas triclosanedens]CAB5556297.1 Uncharacterised protein [Stutzerimonas stutzeri]CAB5598276.1 Uncharacterised protein [Stutzerimonas stutzeri]CAC9158835.1 Uncharacterised protein [Stutzerimonas stutzeri]CAD0188332.1 Hypothetical_protein [Stutzerimonas stutzeri]